MSRLGKRILQIPENVELKIDTYFIKVNVVGPLGSLEKKLSGLVKVIINDRQISTEWNAKNKKGWEMLGTTNALLRNWIMGVSHGFEKDLIIRGLGFKAKVVGRILELHLGFSHQIDYPIPETITITVERNVELNIKGIDKELVGLVASQIRKMKKPEPYKGKGIMYKDERVHRKVGKTAATKK